MAAADTAETKTTNAKAVSMHNPPQERPNTIAGLQEKRKQLVKLRKDLEADVRKVTCDIDHIDACIRLFDPEADTPLGRARYATKHRAKKGQMRRFVLDCLKEADGPITSLDVATAWIKERGLRTDHGTAVMIRKRVGACLTTLQAQGIVQGRDADGVSRLYALTNE
ncbi:MAG: hypothetical protein ACT6TH_08550 [Brevundimonas sp.]|uniref:hypothetical protein n=1 Tax=Brevundimonas sp. TaxID=1871086 RepID=UPI00403439CF